MVWLTELYTPASIGGLRSGMHKLLDRATDMVDKKAIMHSIEKGRIIGAGWTNLPTVVRSGTHIHGHRVVTDDLPIGVASVDLQLVQVTSSITAIVAGFVLTDEYASSIDLLLRERPVAKVQRNSRGTGYSLLYPDSARAEDIEAWRTSLHQSISGWYAKWLPGSLVKMSPSFPLPVVELLITEIAERASGEDYMRILGPGHWDAGWQSVDRPGLYVNEHSFGRGSGNRPILILSAQRANLVDAIDDSNRHNDAYLQVANVARYFGQYSIAGLCTDWALTTFVRYVDSDLSRIRDLLHMNTRNRSAKWLDNVRLNLLRISTEGSLVVSNIIDGHRSTLRVIGNGEFRSEGADNARVLSDIMKEQQVQLGKRILVTEEALRMYISTDAQMTGAVANLRLARSVFWLTVVSVIVAIISAGAAILALKPFDKPTNSPVPQVVVSATPGSQILPTLMPSVAPQVIASP